MGAHHRVAGLRVPGPELLHLPFGYLVLEGEHEVVHREQAVDALLDVVVEAVVGRAHVAEQGVAAGGRNLDGVQDGPHRGHLPPGDVMVPAVLEAAGVAPLLEAHQLGMLGVPGDERVDLQLAEAAGERHVLGRGDRLAAEHQHLVVEQRLADLGGHLIGQVGLKIDAAHLSADGGALRRHVDMPERGSGQSGPLVGQVEPRPEVEPVPVDAHSSGSDLRRGIRCPGLFGGRSLPVRAVASTAAGGRRGGGG